MNGDGYVSTGQGFTGNNMFAYCLNSPVQFMDKTGTLVALANAGGCYNPSTNIGSQILKTMNDWSPAYAICAELGFADGPLPYGEIAGLAAAAVVTLGAAIWGTYQASQSSVIPKAQEQEKDITIPSRKKNQAYFTVNPYDFTPNGLIMTEYPGSKNGRIIEWRDPISKAKIFEWDEDFNNGSHYHAMLIEWDGNHHNMHYLPGTPVPEPWNSIYFGG